MRFTDNMSIATATMDESDIMAGTDVSTGIDKKFTLGNLADYFLETHELTLSGEEQTVKHAIDNIGDVGEIREGLEQEAETREAADTTLNEIKADKTQVDALAEAKADKITVEALDGRVDALAAQFDAVAVETVLFEGSAIGAGTIINLSDSITSYDFLDIYAYKHGTTDIRTIPATTSAEYYLRFTNISNNPSSDKGVQINEMLIQTTSETTVTIANEVTWEWSGVSTANARASVVTPSDAGTELARILKIVGRKLVGNTELSDLRVGYDGTIYASAGQAVRAQISELHDEISEGSGVPSNVRQALYTLLNSAAYTTTGLTDEIAIIQSWASTVTAITLDQPTASISGAGTVQLTATTTPSGGAVTWSSSDTSVATVSSSGLVTSVDNGTATITASSGDVSATCTVTVSGFVTLVSIAAVYTQGGTVYTTDTLDSLKSDLVVTATYDDASTATIASADYTLSGTLTAGTSTITVSYSGQTTTFTVTVTADATYTETILATLAPGDDFTYTAGDIAISTGTATEDAESSYYLSELLTIPTGTTSYEITISARDANLKVAWYDSEQAFCGSGFGGGTYSGNGTYGACYTDTNGKLWSAVPSTAKYCRIAWKNSHTLTDISFKHNIKLDESITPIVGTVYYYTFSTSSTSANTDDYLPCSGMAYAHIRAVYRRGITFYDAEKVAVSTISVANNIGNNVTVPDDAVYIRPGNTTNTSTSSTAVPTRNGVGLIEFTDATLTTW